MDLTGSVWARSSTKMIMSVPRVARLKPGAACDDADQRCALHCPTRLRGRIRQAWIRDAGPVDMRDASPRGRPWLLCVVPGAPGVRRSCLCSGAVYPRGRAGLRSDGRLAGRMAITDGSVCCRARDQDRGLGREETRSFVLCCGKGVIEGERCRRKWLGCNAD